MAFREVVAAVESYIQEQQHTYFVLDNLDTLRKNGRLTGIKSSLWPALLTSNRCSAPHLRERSASWDRQEESAGLLRR